MLTKRENLVQFFYRKSQTSNKKIASSATPKLAITAQECGREDLRKQGGDNAAKFRRVTSLAGLNQSERTQVFDQLTDYTNTPTTTPNPNIAARVIGTNTTASTGMDINLPDMTELLGEFFDNKGSVLVYENGKIVVVNPIKDESRVLFGLEIEIDGKKIVVDYVFDAVTQKSSIWNGSSLFIETHTDIAFLQNILDFLFSNSTLFIEMFNETLAKKIEMRGTSKGKPLILYIDNQGYSSYDDAKKRMKIGNPAPVMIYNAVNNNVFSGIPDPNPRVEHDVFHEFAHYYDTMMDITYSKSDIDITDLSEDIILNYPDNSAKIMLFDSKTTSLSKREEYAVHIENKFRKEQNLPMRLAYPFLGTYPQAATLGGFYIETFDFILIELSSTPNTFKRKYKDGYEYK